LASGHTDFEIFKTSSKIRNPFPDSEKKIPGKKLIQVSLKLQLLFYSCPFNEIGFKKNFSLIRFLGFPHCSTADSNKEIISIYVWQ